MQTEIPKVYLRGGNELGPTANRQWWSEPKETVHTHAYAMFRTIQTQQKYRSDLNLKHARMYANMDLKGLQAWQYGRIDINQLPKNRSTLNVVRACVDTAAAKISKNRPRPLFLTEKGSYSQQSKAKKLTQYVGGRFEECHAYTEGQKAFVDGSVFGTGAVQVVPRDDSLIAERVLIDEIYVDDADGIYGRPLMMYRAKQITRQELLEEYASEDSNLEYAIMAAGTTSWNSATEQAADLLTVIEAWKLPAKKGGKGRHIIFIETATLFDEEWNKDYFPFAFFRWSERLLGFYGSGIAEELAGLQVSINKILRDIELAQHLVGSPKIFMREGSRTSKPMTNEFGAQYYYTGEMPTVWAGNSIGADIYQHLERLYQRAFEIVGISQLSATSKKPAGLDSGAALREYNDIETERFALVGQRWEAFFMEIARIIVDMSKDSNGKVKTKKGKFIESIRWEDVNIEDDNYVMQIFPASLLPTQPAGKLQTVQELFQGGFVDREQALSLLDFPDIQDFLSVQTASIDDIKETLERIIEDGEYDPPEPFTNLQLALRLSQSAYLRAKHSGVEPDKLDLLLKYTDQVLELLSAKAPEPPALPDIPTPPQGIQGQPAML